jgi:hypothetical protein
MGYCRDTRNHENSKQEWSDQELKKLYETHERLLDLVSLFCFVPRAKYLPLGPTRYDHLFSLVLFQSVILIILVLFLFFWGKIRVCPCGALDESQSK